jgi:DNA-binding CsgD family transcriptional regulator
VDGVVSRMVVRTRAAVYPLDSGFSWGCNGAMARLSDRGRRGLEQLRLVAADASSAGLLAERALVALDEAVPFDDGALFALDGSSLVFTRLLAYRGAEPGAMRAWIRDTYLVAREPGSLHFPTLLRREGGSGVYHEDAERWLRASLPPATSGELRAAWRRWESPAGGALRYGLAHRRRWVAALQLARLDPGRGFRAGELELIDRAAPLLARALAAHLAPVTPAPGERPPSGQLLFDEQRRLVSVSASGQHWLALLASDAVAPEVPVAVQALVGQLAGSGRPAGALTAIDRDGGRVAVRAEPALRLNESGAPATGFAVSVASAPLVPGESGLTGAQWAVARAVARGDSDREIAAALQLAPATVHEHVAALHRLLATGTRPRLVAALASSFRDDS